MKNFTTRFAAPSLIATLALIVAGFMLPASGWASEPAPAAKKSTQTTPQPQSDAAIRLAWDRVGSPITPVV